MDVILLQDVENLGEKGQVVSVSDGYMRNYLLPRKLVETASPERIEEARRRMEAEEARLARQAERSGEIAEMLGKTVITIQANAGEDGKLFGSVTAADISDEIQRVRDVRIDKKKIKLEEPIKQTGDYMVEMEVHTGVMATAKIIVAAAE